MKDCIMGTFFTALIWAQICIQYSQALREILPPLTSAKKNCNYSNHEASKYGL